MVKFTVSIDGRVVSESFVESDSVDDAWDFMMWAWDPFHAQMFA